MFILRIDNREVARCKIVKNLSPKIRELNSPNCLMEVWHETKEEQKPFRKNGKVRQTGASCRKLVRYLHSPIGETKILLIKKRKSNGN